MGLVTNFLVLWLVATINMIPAIFFGLGGSYVDSAVQNVGPADFVVLSQCQNAGAI